MQLRLYGAAKVVDERALQLEQAVRKVLGAAGVAEHQVDCLHDEKLAGWLELDRPARAGCFEGVDNGLGRVARSELFQECVAGGRRNLDVASVGRDGDTVEALWHFRKSMERRCSGCPRFAPIDGVMEIEVALRYPNGRVHQTVCESAQEMTAGSEFTMYGRIWRVIGLTHKSRAHVPAGPPPRLLCVAADEPIRKRNGGGDSP